MISSVDRLKNLYFNRFRSCASCLCRGCESSWPQGTRPPPRGMRPLLRPRGTWPQLRELTTVRRATSATIVRHAASAAAARHVTSVAYVRHATSAAVARARGLRCEAPGLRRGHEAHELHCESSWSSARSRPNFDRNPIHQRCRLRHWRVKCGRISIGIRPRSDDVDTPRF